MAMVYFPESSKGNSRPGEDFYQYHVRAVVLYSEEVLTIDLTRQFSTFRFSRFPVKLVTFLLPFLKKLPLKILKIFFFETQVG